jgi:hypothetical protein
VVVVLVLMADRGDITVSCLPGVEILDKLGSRCIGIELFTTGTLIISDPTVDLTFGSLCRLLLTLTLMGNGDLCLINDLFLNRLAVRAGEHLGGEASNGINAVGRISVYLIGSADKLGADRKGLGDEEIVNPHYLSGSDVNKILVSAIKLKHFRGDIDKGEIICIALLFYTNEALKAIAGKFFFYHNTDSYSAIIGQIQLNLAAECLKTDLGLRKGYNAYARKHNAKSQDHRKCFKQSVFHFRDSSSN